MAARKKLKVRDEAKPKNNLYVGVKGEGDTAVHVNKKSGSLQVEAKEQGNVLLEKPVVVFNRLPHDVTLSYNGSAMIVAPRMRAPVANVDKLGALPKGVTLLPYNTKYRKYAK